MAETVTATPEGETRIIVTRRFAAPPARVMALHLDAEAVKSWMGRADNPMTEGRSDPRPGGSFRYVWTLPEGPDQGSVVLNGVFDEISEGRVVHRERYDPDWTGGETRVITEFTADFGPTGMGTVMRMDINYPSLAIRDRALEMGMSAGMENSYQQLDAML